MNKKLFAVLMILCLQMPVFAGSYLDKQLKESKKNVKYNSVKKHTAKYTLPKADPDVLTQIKDPKLIKLSNVKPVNETAYKNKLANDEIIYKTKIIPALRKNMNTVNVQPDDVDFYKIYRILERIIRANNLDYINWRLILAEDTTSINAMTTAGNLIIINSSLLDTFHNNHDALAFIIAHELSHQILGHMQQGADSTKSDIQNYLLHTATLGYSSIIRDKIQNKKES